MAGEKPGVKLLRIRKALEAGRLPAIKQPLPELMNLLKAYGLRPGIDIYIPWINSETRDQFNWKLRYRRQREKAGDQYKSQADRRLEKLKKEADKKLSNSSSPTSTK